MDACHLAEGGHASGVASTHRHGAAGARGALHNLVWCKSGARHSFYYSASRQAPRLAARGLSATPASGTATSPAFPREQVISVALLSLV